MNLAAAMTRSATKARHENRMPYAYSGTATPLYCDTGGAQTFIQYSTQATFKNNLYPANISTGNLDEDVMILMNDGIEFYQSQWQNFDRWYSIYQNTDELNTRQYIFFVRPELYLVDQTGSNSKGGIFELSKTSRTYWDPFFRYMNANHSVILRSLTAEFGKNKTDQRPAAASGAGQGGYADASVDMDGTPLTIHSWIPYLVGRTETLAIPDYIIKTFDVVQPYTKYAVPYSTSAIESQSGGTFECTFREDSQLRVHKLFYSWLYYMDGVMRNKFQPKEKYLIYNAFDYMSSVYHIVCDITGTDIIWWSKYTGVIPTQVPNSDLSWNRGSETDSKVTIPFKFFHHEALNPQILTDFNYNSLGYNYMRGKASSGRLRLQACPVYDADHGITGPALVGRPFISVENRDGFRPKLNWMYREGLSRLIDR